MIDLWKIRDIQQEVLAELISAYDQYAQIDGASAHEGYAIIKEELDELWDEIKLKGTKERMREEAIQVAAMAIRFIDRVTDIQRHASTESGPFSRPETGDERVVQASDEDGTSNSSLPSSPGPSYRYQD